jgi:hypothetical protein
MNVQHAKKLDDISSRIHDAEKIIQIVLLKSKELGPENKELLETAVDFLSVAKTVTHEVAKSIGDGGASSYLHEREEAELRRTLPCDHTAEQIVTCTPLRNIQNYLQSNEDILNEEKRKKYNTLHRKELKQSKGGIVKCSKNNENGGVIIVASVNHLNTRSHQEQLVQVAKPANGYQYTAHEAAQILSKVKYAQPVMNKWIEQKLVPCKKARLYEIVKAYKEGKPLR